MKAGKEKKEEIIRDLCIGSEWEKFFLDKCDCKWKSCASFFDAYVWSSHKENSKAWNHCILLHFKMFEWMQDNLGRKAQETEDAAQCREVSTRNSERID